MEDKTKELDQTNDAPVMKVSKEETGPQEKPLSEEEKHQLQVEDAKRLKIYKENLEHNLKVLRLEEEYNRLRLSSLESQLKFDNIIAELKKREANANK